MVPEGSIDKPEARYEQPRPYGRGRPWTLVIMVCFAGFAASAQGFVTLGPSPDCDYDTSAGAGHLQQALTDGHAELRLVGEEEYLGAIGVLVSVDKRIIGGYASCAAAASGQAPDPAARSRLRPALGQDVLVQVLAHPGGPKQLQLRNLDLVAIPAVPGIFGLGLILQGKAEVVLDNSEISGFRWTGFGGGAAVVGGTLSLYDSAILNNRSRRGGGIYCNSNGRIRLMEGSRITGNRAEDAPGEQGHGGGVSLDECELHIETRVDLGTSFSTLLGINENEATGSGGGVHVQNGSVRVLGGPMCTDAPAHCPPGVFVMSDNLAHVSGGAISLHESSLMDADFFLLASNRAGRRGGGIHAEGGSQARLGQGQPLSPELMRRHCPVGLICHALAGNVSGGDGGPAWGGGVALQDSELAAANLILADNGSVLATQVYANGDSRLLLYQSWVRDESVVLQDVAHQLSILINGSSSAKIRQSSLMGATPNTALIAATDDASLLLERSLVMHRTPGMHAVAITSNTTRSGTCNARMGASTADDLDMIEVDESDVDTDALPIPRRGGALEDRCEPSGVSDWPSDLRGLARFEIGEFGNPATPLDIGALEADATAIFVGGFEDPNAPILRSRAIPDLATLLRAGLSMRLIQQPQGN